MQPSERMKRLPEQFFAQLIATVANKQAQGMPVINLGQGNPDQATPDNIVQALIDAAPNPLYQRYIPFSGLNRLKEAVATWYQSRHNVNLDPVKEVAIVIGSKLGLQEIALALLNPGDHAMVPDPGYPDYLSGIALAGAQTV
ncbi:MAG: aminotransferase class I/II-fold pyridoxal phosphate-dependent enzyme, partial [Firmicutes bacterium]|nr:aminotransferase class I/II-fold pyridoxal phosphate-dependent enzyme [Bacillota bacterium]